VRRLEFQRMEGEAVFYGPKIDIKIKDALGRYWQCTTIQFDFNMSERFGMKYIGADGSAHQPYMVHRALLGSLERFFGVLIEHYNGFFPLWLAPVQVAIAPVSDDCLPYARGVLEQLLQHSMPALRGSIARSVTPKCRKFPISSSSATRSSRKETYRTASIKRATKARWRFPNSSLK